jgi:hypothetical protein
MKAASALAEAAEDLAGRVLDCLYSNGLAIVTVIFVRASGVWRIQAIGPGL